MIVDYFLIRKTNLDVDGLFQRSGPYEYRGGVNMRAIGALATGIVTALIGLVVPPLRWLYDYAWFAGFAIAGSVYYVAMRFDAASVPSAVAAEASE
jgi:nucleobase:cation symporter-1, NCS1 family